MLPTRVEQLRRRRELGAPSPFSICTRSVDSFEYEEDYELIFNVNKLQYQFDDADKAFERNVDRFETCVGHALLDMMARVTGLFCCK